MQPSEGFLQPACVAGCVEQRTAREIGVEPRADRRQRLRVAGQGDGARFEGRLAVHDHVGQAGKKMLSGEPTPPPMRNGEAWTVGIRFLERAQGSNFKSEILYPLALWTRERWEEVCDKGVGFMAHIEDNLPILREALQEPRNDAAFIANMLLLGAPAVEMDMQDEVQGMLRSLARR